MFYLSNEIFVRLPEDAWATPQQTIVNFYYLDFLFIKLGTTQARILTVFLNELQRRKLLGGFGGMHPRKIFSSTPSLVPSRYLCVSGVREDWGLFWGARGLMGRSKENTPEDTKLRGGSLIEPCAIVPGEEKISNR